MTLNSTWERLAIDISRKRFLLITTSKWLFVSLFCLGMLYPKSPFADGVDLHAHLFMKEGMGWLFQGGFHDPLHANSWQDRLSSQINQTSLEHSKLNLVVATLYAHPLLTRSLKDSVRKQIRLAHDFVHQNPNWVLAVHPEQARQALRFGKQVIILALEGASGILETEEDFHEFIDEGGIRIVTILHLTDDSLGGVAFLKGILAASSPWAFLKSLFSPHMDSEGVRVNENGLTPHGKRITQALLERNIWIDLAHASDASQKEIFPILAKRKQPHLYTHTVLRKYHTAERGISFDQLKKVQETQGIVGLIPSDTMLRGTPTSGECSESTDALRAQFHETSEWIPEISIGIGSDFNGALPHLRPTCETHTSLDQEGFWNIGQSHELWNVLHQKQKKHAIADHALRFIEAWSLVWKKN